MHPSQDISLPAAITSNRIGVMGCCVMELGFKEHCAASKTVGASYVETFAFKLNPSVMPAAEAKQALQENEQELLLMIAENLDLDNPDTYLATLREHVAYWKACGLTTFVTLRGPRSERRDEFLALLKRAGDVVREAGFTPLSQNHVGGMIENEQELAACSTANVGLHFDTQQFFNAGVDPIAAWNFIGTEIVHVHLADRDVEKNSVLCGTGVIGIDRLLRRMHATGYRGAITLEPEIHKDASALPDIKQYLDYCQAVLAPLDACGTTSIGHSVYHKADAHKVVADWGSLHWLSNDDIIDNSQQTVGFVNIKPGHANPAHQHPTDHEVIIIQNGTCRHFCGEYEVRLNKGDVLHLVPGQPHYAINDGDVDCEMIVLYPTGRRSFEKVKQTANA